jgi:aminoglycoside/choline kinase family phosphotransferase
MEEPLKQLFRSVFGAPAESFCVLRGDGSARRIYRLAGAGRTAVGVHGPDPRENRAFLEFSRHFRREGLPVPEIYAEDASRGIYLEEDLGDVTLFDLLASNRGPAGLKPAVLEAYRRTIAALPLFQAVAGKSLDYRLCHPRASFDKQSMMWDLNYFKYYFLRLSGVPFNEQDLENDFKRFVDFLLEAERDFFLYRDFQSRNVMMRDGKPHFIDYQGGRKGALQYDVASLLYDAKADLPAQVREKLLDHYLAAASRYAPVDPARFLKYFPGFTYIRILQALGAYGLRGFYERKPHFLQSIPYAVANIARLRESVELPVKLPELMRVFDAVVSAPALRQFAEAENELSVRVESFSYRRGLPDDPAGNGGGFVFDCRALPNPGRDEMFAPLTGKDPEVARFLEADPAVARFLNGVFSIVEASVENYRSRNFTNLLVCFGCTGGRHRSVYCAERLARRLKDRGRCKVELRHREQESPG